MLSEAHTEKWPKSEFPVKKFPNFILCKTEKQITLSERTGKENSFEWSHRSVSSTDSKVKTTLPGFIH